MKDFKEGFYITSQKKERKPEATLDTSSYTQPQPFSNKQPRIQQEERKQTKKTTYTETPTSEEQPRKQLKSALQQEISEFNPSCQMSMEQLIKVDQIFRKRFKIEAFERKTNDQAGRKNEMDKSRIDNYESQMDAFYNMKNHQDMNTTTLKDLAMKQEQEIQLLKESRMEQLYTGSILMVVKPQAQPRMRLIPIRKRCFCCGSQQHLYRNCRKFQQKQRDF